MMLRFNSAAFLLMQSRLAKAESIGDQEITDAKREFATLDGETLVTQ